MPRNQTFITVAVIGTMTVIAAAGLYRYFFHTKPKPKAKSNKAVSTPCRSPDGKISNKLSLKEKEAEELKKEGNTFFREQNYEKAIQCYGKAIDLCPELKEAYFNRAQTFFKTNAFLRALADAERCVVLDPTNAKNHHLCALSHQALGDVESARAGFRRVLDLAPDHGAARLRLFEIEREQLRPQLEAEDGGSGWQAHLARVGEKRRMADDVAPESDKKGRTMEREDDNELAIFEPFRSGDVSAVLASHELAPEQIASHSVDNSAELAPAQVTSRTGDTSAELATDKPSRELDPVQATSRDGDNSAELAPEQSTLRSGDVSAEFATDKPSREEATEQITLRRGDVSAELATDKPSRELDPVQVTSRDGDNSAELATEQITLLTGDVSAELATDKPSREKATEQITLLTGDVSAELATDKPSHELAAEQMTSRSVDNSAELATEQMTSSSFYSTSPFASESFFDTVQTDADREAKREREGALGADLQSRVEFHPWAKIPLFSNEVSSSDAEGYVEADAEAEAEGGGSLMGVEDFEPFGNELAEILTRGREELGGMGGGERAGEESAKEAGDAELDELIKNSRGEDEDASSSSSSSSSSLSSEKPSEKDNADVAEEEELKVGEELGEGYPDSTSDEDKK